ADQSVPLHQLHRVKVAHGVGLVLGPLPGHGVGQGGDGLVAVPLAGGGLQGLFDAGRLGKLVLVLGGGLGGVHAAGGADRVAAHHGLALDDDDVFALVGGGDGGGHACAARAHDDDVGIHHAVLSGGGVPAAGEVGRIQAGGGQSGGQGLVDGVGGDGGARDHVDGALVARDDLLGRVLDDHRADALGLAVAHDLTAGDDAVGQGDGDGHLAHAGGGAGELARHAPRSVPGAGRSRRGRGAAPAAGGQAKGHDGCQRERCNAFSHDVSSFLRYLVIWCSNARRPGVLISSVPDRYPLVKVHFS